MAYDKPPLASPPKSASAEKSSIQSSSSQGMSDLILGYQRFRSASYRTHEATYRALGRHGQRPPVLVIACADSRVDPSVIFDSPPGELFCIRNVANLVPPYCPDGGMHGVSAALEYR